MTPTVIQRLHATLTSERVACGHPAYSETTLSYERLTNADLAAVEQELAAKDAEIAELRKRPALEELLAAFPPELRPDELYLIRVGHGMALTCVREQVRSLYAEKARTEAQK